MATPVINPETGEREQQPQTNAPQIDPNTGERIRAGGLPAGTEQEAWKATVYSKMLDTNPGYAYQNLDTIDQKMRETGGDDFDKGFGYAAKTGFEETPLGMWIRGQAPEPFESHDILENFVHDVVSMASDPVMLIPTAIGAAMTQPEAGLAIGGFVDAGLRKGLMDHYQKGDAKSFRDLTDRAGDILWAATKGGLTAEAMGAAADIPVPGVLARSPLTSMAMKGFYQAGAVTAAGSILDAHMPNVEDFTRSAALIVPLNMASGGLLLRAKPSEQALMDVYAKDGTHPVDSVEKLNAQPVVAEDQPAGLRVGIKFDNTFVEGEAGETHPELTSRVAGQEPIDLDRLNADPSLADNVLNFPEPHLQQVIDRALEIKTESGEEITPEQRRAKSGRGFVTPDGKFLSRSQARAWVKENDPQTASMWEQITGNRNAEFHADDYAQARSRVGNRNVAEGEPDYALVSRQNAQRLAAAREDLNQIKAGNADAGYAKQAIRTLFVGQRDARIALTSQIRDAVQKIIPDYQDQEALSFLRDYKDNPQGLREEAAAIAAGDDAELKRLLPSIERALNPSPQLQQADALMTQYYSAALDEGRELGFLESNIPPDRYVTHVLMKKSEAEEEAGRVTRPKLATRTPYALERKYPTILDALKTGMVDARTVNALDAMSVYGERHATAAATKIFTTELKNSELGKWASREEKPAGWVELAPQRAGFHQTMTIKNAETGENVTFSRGLYVPKQVADAMRPIVTQNVLASEITGFLQLRHAQSYIKAVELGFSIFHMKALSITAMNNMSYGDFVKAIGTDLKSPEFAAIEREAAASGLTTTKTTTPYEAYKGLKPSSMPTRLDLIRGTFPIKQLDSLAQTLTHDTFDVIQRKFKVMDYSLKTAAWLAKHPDAPDTEYFAAQRSIAREVNAAYGGLNWEVMGWGPNAREIARAFILAPDWTFSNLANLKYAGEGGPGGNAARMFWIKSFTTGFALTQAVSLLTSGQMSKHPTEVYLGQDDKGKDMYANVFFAGAPKDALTWMNRVQKDGGLTGTVEFMSYKAAPLIGVMPRLIVNRDWTGKPITKPQEGPIEKTARETAFAAEQVLPAPFSVKDAIQGMLTNQEKDYSYKDFLMSLAGITVQHESEPAPKRSEKFRLPGNERRRFHPPGERMRR